MNILDSLTTISLIAINIDVLLQNIKVYKRKSSLDVSLLGTFIRYTAIIILLAKYLALQDGVLVVGQLVILVNVGVYTALVFRYRKGNTKFSTGVENKARKY